MPSIIMKTFKGILWIEKFLELYSTYKTFLGFFVDRSYSSGL